MKKIMILVTLCWFAFASTGYSDTGETDTTAYKESVEKQAI